MRTIENPKTVAASGPTSDSVATHPSFAQIGASRVSGQANLYGSDFAHQHYVTISIRTSELHRGLSRDWHFGRKELIEVALSESQWATFVSSMNVGSGVPCTLQCHDGKLIPGLPSPEPLTNKFNDEMMQTMSDIQGDMKDLIAQVDALGLSKAKSTELKRQLETIKCRVTQSTGFVAKQFEKHVEDVVESAKIEVNAYVMNQVTRAGLDSLKAPISLLGHGQSVD